MTMWIRTDEGAVVLAAHAAHQKEPIMSTILRDCALVVLLWVLVGTPTHLAFEQSADPCATGEIPCDPNRPWMRGSTEKSCARPEHLAEAKKARPGGIVLECKCQHVCDPQDKHAAETNDRKWDALCEARCNPGNCGCRHPCEEETR